MDRNQNQRGGGENGSGGRRPNGRYHQRRRPAEASGHDETSPNGAINVKPGRYDLPPTAENKENVIIRQKSESTEKNEPQREQKQKSDRQPRQDRSKQERQKNRPANSAQESQRQAQSNEQRPRAEQSAEQTPARQQERTDGQERGKSRRPRRRKSNRRAEERRIPTEISETPAEGETSEKLSAPAETSAQPSETAPDRKKDRQKRQPRNRRREHASETKNVSASELNEIKDEEIAITEYIAATGQSDYGAFSEADIIEELNSTEHPEQETKAPETAENSEPVPMIEVVGVRFKSGGKVYYFAPENLNFVRDDPVIVDTARGMEFGKVELANRQVPEREVVLPLRKVVRRATPEDIQKAEENRLKAEEALSVCAKKIEEHKLDMKLVDVEYAFDNSKLLFYFTAEGRVDFRELVKDLASVFRTRIELRQIGIRDETKLLGGIGICGRPFCCKTFLSDFVQVSIKMAKEQNLSLNSVKISGACGRLMCCLRYEYDTYQEEIRRTPKVDQIVSTPDGDGIVTEVQPLAGLIRVRFLEKPDSQPKVFHRDNVTVIGQKAPKQPKTAAAQQPKKAPDPKSRKSAKEQSSPDPSFEANSAKAREAAENSSEKASSGINMNASEAAVMREADAAENADD